MPPFHWHLTEEMLYYSTVRENETVNLISNWCCCCK